MTDLSRSELRGLLAFVSTLGKFESVVDLREGLLPELRRLVPADSATYTEIRPLTGEAAWWTDPDSVGKRADPEPFAEFLDQHPVGNFHQRVDGRAVQFSDFLNRRELHRLDLYNDFYRPLEVEHQIAITVDAPGPLLVPISLQRKRGAFPERTRAMLDLLRPHLERTYKELDARERSRRALEAVDEATKSHGPAVIALGRAADVEFATGPGRRWLHEYFERDGAGRGAGIGERLPRKLESWLHERRTRPNGRGGGPAATLVVPRPGKRLEIRHLPAQAAGERDALLLEEHRERLDPAELRAAGLTRRESEVLAWAATGCGNKEIGERLYISPRTVQKHLENVCRKLGVTTRTAAVARAFALPAPSSGPEGLDRQRLDRV